MNKSMVVKKCVMNFEFLLVEMDRMMRVVELNGPQSMIVK